MDPITKNQYKRDFSQPTTLYLYFRVRNWFNFLLMTCLYPNPPKLAYLWRFVTSSIIHYCHRFRTVEYFSAHTIRSFVPRHAFMHFCQSLLLASLVKSHFVWLSSQFRAPSNYWNCLFASALSKTFPDWYEENPILMFSYNWSIELFFFLFGQRSCGSPLRLIFVTDVKGSVFKETPQRGVFDV